MLQHLVSIVLLKSLQVGGRMRTGIGVSPCSKHSLVAKRKGSEAKSAITTGVLALQTHDPVTMAARACSGA